MDQFVLVLAMLVIVALGVLAWLATAFLRERRILESSARVLSDRLRAQLQAGQELSEELNDLAAQASVDLIRVQRVLVELEAKRQDVAGRPQ